MGNIRKAAVPLLLTLLIATACGGKPPEALIASGKAYLEKGDPKAASIQFKNALQSSPDLAEARYLLGVAFLSGGDPSSAEQELRKALAAGFPANLVVPKIAACLLARGQYKKVIGEFASSALDSKTSVAQLQTTLSKAYSASGDTTAAAASLSAALAADPTYRPARILLARRKASSKDFDGALVVLDQLTGPGTSDAEVWTLRGEILEHGKSQADAAMTAYRKAVEARPDYLPAHMAIVASALAKNDLASALAQVAAMKKAAPSAPQTVYQEAQLAYIKGDNKLALERAELLLKRLPDNIAALQLAGAIELRRGSLVKADAYLSKAVQLAPSWIAPRQYLVTTYLRAGRLSKALETLQAGRVNGELPAAMFSLAGEVYLRNGDSKRAEDYFQKATAIDPENAGKRTTLALARMIRSPDGGALGELEGIASADKGVSADLALISARLERKDYAKALAAIDALESKRPTDPVSAQLRGRTLLLQGDREGARKSFERALALSPDFMAAITSLASMDLTAKRPGEARQRFERVLAKDPSNVQALLAMAQIAAVEGRDRSEVSALIGKAVTANRLDPAPRRALIDFYLHEKDVKQASTAAADAVAVIPENAELLDALGRTQRAAGEWNQALGTYAKIAALRPEAPEPLMRAAEVQMEMKDRPAAERSLRKVLELSPGYLDAQLRLVQLQVAGRRYADAVAIAKLVQKQRPKEPAGYLMEADIALAQGDRAASVSVLRRGILESPSSGLAIKLHAILNALRPEDGAQFANAWTKGHPNDAAFFFHMGDVALTSKNYPAAMEYYLAVVRVQPRDAPAYNNLAWLAIQLGKGGALEYANKANQLAPGQPAYMDTLATVLASNRDYSNAIEWQKKALAAQPENSQFRLALAKMYQMSGDKKSARQELEVLAKLGDGFSAHAEVNAMLAAR